MNTRSSATGLLPAVVLLFAFPGAVAGQSTLPTLARLEALRLNAVDGDVPARYSRTVSRNVAIALAKRVADCRGLLGAAAPRPAIVLAILDETDWPRVTDRAYGVPHHSTADSPYVIVMPQSWRAAPMYAGVRAQLAGALGADEVDRFVHLIALHEVGHLLTNAALNTTTQEIRTRYPLWYGEFTANYFADACLAPHSEEGAFHRRGVAALAAIPRQRFTTLDDAGRVLIEKDPSGRPYILTEAGRLNFARYQGFTAHMAGRLRDAGVGTARVVEIVRQQWARPGRQGTDVLVKDFAVIAPGWNEWLIEQGAIAGPRIGAGSGGEHGPNWRGRQFGRVPRGTRGGRGQSGRSRSTGSTRMARRAGGRQAARAAAASRLPAAAVEPRSLGETS